MYCGMDRYRVIESQESNFWTSYIRSKHRQHVKKSQVCCEKDRYHVIKAHVSVILPQKTVIIRQINGRQAHKFLLRCGCPAKKMHVYLPKKDRYSVKKARVYFPKKDRYGVKKSTGIFSQKGQVWCEKSTGIFSQKRQLLKNKNFYFCLFCIL